jgi:hypothetical protein
VTRPFVGRLRRAHAGAGMLAVAAPARCIATWFASRMVAADLRHRARYPLISTTLRTAIAVSMASINGELYQLGRLPHGSAECDTELFVTYRMDDYVSIVNIGLAYFVADIKELNKVS